MSGIQQAGAPHHPAQAAPSTRRVLGKPPGLPGGKRAGGGGKWGPEKQGRSSLWEQGGACQPPSLMGGLADMGLLGEATTPKTSEASDLSWESLTAVGARGGRRGPPWRGSSHCPGQDQVFSEDSAGCAALPRPFWSLSGDESPPEPRPPCLRVELPNPLWWQSPVSQDPLHW